MILGIDSVTTDILLLADTDVGTLSDAQTTINSLDAAINFINDQRSNLDAVQNRLGYADSNLSTIHNMLMRFNTHLKMFEVSTISRRWIILSIIGLFLSMTILGYGNTLTAQWFNAIYNEDKQTLKELIEDGIDVNAKNENGNTALHLAAEWGVDYWVAVLLQHGADIDAINQDGNTALHLAAKNEEIDCVEILLDYYADLEIGNKDEDTAFDLTNSKEIEDLIEKYSDSNNFNLIFDYRYDNGFISDNRERQKTMDYIEDLYESIIISVHTVAANTSLKIRRSYTSTGFDTISYPKGVNGFVIFVVAYDFSKYKTAQGVLKPGTSKASGATTGIDNIGIIHINTKKGNKWFFDSTPNTINDLLSKTHYDAISTIVHELGHTFKILRSYQQPYIIKEGGIEKFNGKNTRSKNKGTALPLDTGSSHTSKSFGPIEYLVRPQLDRLMMHGSDPIQGFRTLMSPLDMAMLDDLGYDIDYSKIPKPLYGNPSDLKKYQSQNLPKHIQSTATTKPVGLWVFNNAKSAHNSVIGAPMKYMPPARKTGILPELYQDNHIKVPNGGHLIINHALTDASQYSLLMDVKLTNSATWIPLFNTNYTASNYAELYINQNLKFYTTNQYSPEISLDRQNWHRILCTYNKSEKQVAIYLNGTHIHTFNNAGSRFEMWSRSSLTPFFVLFGDDAYPNPGISLASAALYDRVLTSKEARALGNSSNLQFGL